MTIEEEPQKEVSKSLGVRSLNDGNEGLQTD